MRYLLLSILLVPTISNAQLYVKPDAGALFNHSTHIETKGHTGKVKFGTGYSLGAEVGYKLNNLELGIQTDYQNIPVKSITVAGRIQKLNPKRVEGYSVVSMVRYNFDHNQRTVPFIGAGIGIKESMGIDPVAQVEIGVRHHFSQRLSMEVTGKV